MTASHQTRAHRTAAERLAALLLLFALLVSLVSCGTEPPIVTEGLTVLETPTVPPSEAAVAEAEQVFEALFLLATEQALGSAVPPGTQKTVEAHAEEVARLLSESGTDDAGYRAVTAILAQDGEAAVTEWFGGSKEGYPCLRALYLSLTEHLSTEALSDLAYALLDYSYTFRCEAAWERAETYRDREALYLRYLQKYEALSTEADTFRSEIDRDCFSAAFRTLLMLSELFTEAEGDTASLTAFTPTELTVFLRLIPLEEIETSTEGYELLLSLAARETGGIPSRLLFAAQDAGDLPTVAAELGGLLALLTHLRDAMSSRDAALLRERDHKALLVSLSGTLGEEDRATLARLEALSLDRAAYDAVGLAEWGDAYAAYAEGLSTVTAAELLAAAGTDAFAALLPRYLANITPVLSYCYETQ